MKCKSKLDQSLKHVTVILGEDNIRFSIDDYRGQNSQYYRDIYRKSEQK